MVQYKCSKHGFLDASERLIWAGRPERGRWCMHCYNECMTKFIKDYVGSEITEINDELKGENGNGVQRSS